MNNNLGNKETMAKNLKYYMVQKGVNQSELAIELDIPVTTISNWLHANTYPRIDKIEKMATFFGISKSDLVEEPSNNSDDEYRAKDEVEKELLMLCRNATEADPSKKKELVDAFESTIDLYKKLNGIK